MGKFGVGMKSRWADYCIAFVLGCLAFLLCDTGSIGYEKDVIAKNDAHVVGLKNVKAPEYKEDFATLDVGDKSLIVYWAIGISNASNFMWYNSGYPGFDYPMVIEICKESINYFKDENYVNLTTQWGNYSYKKILDGFAYKESDNLVDKNTGNPVINFGKIGEDLVVWDKTSQIYYVYEKKKGTTIQI